MISSRQTIRTACRRKARCPQHGPKATLFVVCARPLLEACSGEISTLKLFHTTDRLSTDHLPIIDDLDFCSGQADHLAHAAGFGPSSLRVFGACFLGWICAGQTDPALAPTKAGEELL